MIELVVWEIHRSSERGGFVERLCDGHRAAGAREAA